MAQSTYFPTIKTLERNFGGLRKLRGELGYPDVHFGAGSYRSEISSRIGKRGLEKELEVERVLVARFGEFYVHSQKRVGYTRRRVDFLVYSPDTNLAVDVFFPDHAKSLTSHLHTKIRRYGDIPSDVSVVLLNMNEKITQGEMDDYCAARKRPVPSHFRALSWSAFQGFILKFRPYPDPRSSMT